MNASTKILKAAAGAAGDAVTVDQVFSTTLYTGNATTRNIQNGIDLTKGGLVWTKARSASDQHVLYDTERGTSVRISTNDTDGNTTDTNEITAFNSDGYTLNSGGGFTNDSPTTYVSYTFRQAPNFFDIVEFQGDGTSNRSITHNITNAGLIVVKQINSAGNWFVWHRHFSSLSSGSGYIQFNSQYQAIDTTGVIDNITSTSFDVHAGATNGSGQSFVAYIFADNSSDSSIDAADRMIACGSYSSGASGTETPPEVSIGFEPQWLLVKNITTGGSGNPWILVDTMRGWTIPSTTMTQPRALDTSLSNAEGTTRRFGPTATGFLVRDYHSSINYANQTYIFMAIRRDNQAEITDATDLFAVSQQISNGTGPSYVSNFPVDMAINRFTSGTDAGLSDRLRGAKDLLTTHTLAEYSNSVKQFDFSDGYYAAGAGANSSYYSWMWKRAKSYFDVVAYTGTGVAGRTVSHSLAAIPEMMWVKKRASPGSWAVYHSGANAETNPENYHFFLNNTSAESTDNNYYWYQTAPTATEFSLGISANVNQNNVTFIAYLFATLAGVSKVSSVVHSGTTNVDAGFSNGCRFLLLKRADATGDWLTYDSTRGIVSGNDPYLLLNSTAAQVTNTDYIDPYSAGFTLTSSLTAGTYIYYAIA